MSEPVKASPPELLAVTLVAATPPLEVVVPEVGELDGDVAAVEVAAVEVADVQPQVVLVVWLLDGLDVQPHAVWVLVGGAVWVWLGYHVQPQLVVVSVVTVVDDVHPVVVVLVCRATAGRLPVVAEAGALRARTTIATPPSMKATIPAMVNLTDDTARRLTRCIQIPRGDDDPLT